MKTLKAFLDVIILKLGIMAPLRPPAFGWKVYIHKLKDFNAYSGQSGRQAVRHKNVCLGCASARSVVTWNGHWEMLHLQATGGTLLCL